MTLGKVETPTEVVYIHSISTVNVPFKWRVSVILSVDLLINYHLPPALRFLERHWSDVLSARASCENCVRAVSNSQFSYSPSKN